MPPRSPFPLLTTSSDARTATLQGLLIGAIVIAALYVGREVLLPLALAILLSFVLTPPLLLLRKIKVPRVLAVTIVVTTAFGIIFGLGWLMSREATDLAADLPNYRATLSEKIKSFRESTSELSVLTKAGDVLSDLQQELSAPTDGAPNPTVGTKADKPDDKPLPVEITTPEPTGWALYQTIFSTLLPPLATAGIVLLFVIFILLQREDLRDRLIRLFGGSDLQRATSTMTDAATRLSRYFLSQVLINFAYGALIAAALWLIGVPSPIAWGILAGLMRFVPYVGALYRRRPAAADRRGDRSRLDHLHLGVGAVPGGRADHGPGGRAASVRPWHRRDADRSHHRDHLLDLAVGPARPAACHAADGGPRRARPPCRRAGILRRAARRYAGADAAATILPARADRRRRRGHLPRRARPQGSEPRLLSRHRGAQRLEARRARRQPRRLG